MMKKLVHMVFTASMAFTMVSGVWGINQENLKQLPTNNKVQAQETIKPGG